jgi:predicted CxxxxCH...CXXCH cytochrome family protein
MKTCQSTGYFQQAPVILLLCLVSSFVFAGSALALTGNNIDQCYDCHGSLNDVRPIDSSYRNITTGGFVGSHLKHIAAVTTAVSTCVPCHGVAPASMSHRNGLINFTSNINNSTPPGTYSKGRFFNQTSLPVLGTCSNVNCHANVYGTGATVTPTWGVVSGCASCHSGAGLIVASGPATGSHAAHATAVCTNCHNANTTATTSPTVGHIDNNITVTGGYPANVTKHAIGTYTGKCSTTTCHGSSSPTWGVNLSTSDVCTKCHGTLTNTGTITAAANNRYLIAPPNSISGVPGTLTGTGQVSNNTKVGAHQTHLRYLNGFSNYSTLGSSDFMCVNCHGTLPVTGTHASGSSVPAFQGMAKHNGTMTPTWTAGTYTCSNTYCHNPAGTGGSLNAANNGTGIAPVWTDAAYIADGTLKTEANCNKCHKSPGAVAGTITVTSTTSHAAFTIATDCSGCHGHNGNATGVAGKRHMDGIKFGGGGSCNSCHDYDTTGGGTAWGVTNFGGTPGMEGRGAHAKHIEYLKTRFSVTLNASSDAYGAGAAASVCGVCHSNIATDHSTGTPTAARSIVFAAGRQFGTSAPLYNGVYNTSSIVNQKSCSNLDCHYTTTPLWSAQ